MLPTAGLWSRFNKLMHNTNSIAKIIHSLIILISKFCYPDLREENPQFSQKLLKNNANDFLVLGAIWEDLYGLEF